MIEQTGALNSQVQNERVARDNAAAPAGQQQQPREQEAVQQQQPSTDTVSLSEEAVALARAVTPANVVPANETSTVEETAPPPAAQQTATENPGEPSRAGSIDIQA